MPELYGGQNPFIYHIPNPDQIERITLLRDGCAALLVTILENVPAGPEQDIAIRKLEEVSMWGNKAIVFEQP